MNGVSLHWFARLFEPQAVGDFGGALKRSLLLALIVMGDFITFGVMGGQQIASAGKVVEARLNALQFPPAAANAVILLAVTLLIIVALNRIVDIRKEL